MVWCDRQEYKAAPSVPLARSSTYSSKNLNKCAVSTSVEMGLLVITQCPLAYRFSDFDSSQMRRTAC
ncbi:hypothetical protein EV363DRAFT_1180029 [Boletus edulis]|nr:hypothetical protein EV363DRAFT_1180029 [Boletus edulis]